ncbi:hypothetical protein E4U28_007868 [Claviceps purpurea]|nr:hypothetical protein E4U28_007868 [Claviceps purpurea]
MAVKPKGRADTGDARNVLKKPSQSRSDVRSIKPARLALRRMGCPFEGISGENRSAIESVGNFCSPSCRVHEPRTLASLGFRGRPPPFLAKIASLTPSKRPGQVSISDGAVDIVIHILNTPWSPWSPCAMQKASTDSLSKWRWMVLLTVHTVVVAFPPLNWHVSSIFVCTGQAMGPLEKTDMQSQDSGPAEG